MNDAEEIPTQAGGWVWVNKNFPNIIAGYRNGTIRGDEVAAPGGVVLLRPRRLYEDQLSPAERLLIIQ